MCAATDNSFHSMYSHGFVRAAVCVPSVRVGDPRYNTERTLDLAERASELNAAIALFPELGLSAYSNDDLFHQDALLDAAVEGVRRLVAASRSLVPILIVGAPLRLQEKLFNCAIVMYRGRLLGVTPKTYLPNYREFYEKRQFTAGRDALMHEALVLDQRVPFGNDLIYDVTNVPGFSIHVEICEDVWVPIPPSTYAAFAGATVLMNLSASNITIGKADYRRSLCASQSAKCLAAYLYAAAGTGESTTDLAWDGHAMIYENGERLAESNRFASEQQLIVADVDLQHLVQERMRMTSFNDSACDHRDRVAAIRHVPIEFVVPKATVALQRHVERFPYVPSNPAARDDRCAEAYNIQVHGLTKRLTSAGIQKVVIGVSGGLDSTHALIVAVKAMDRLSLPRTNVLAFTMPGFATSETTRANAWDLMRLLGVTAEGIDIKPSCLHMLKNLPHHLAAVRSRGGCDSRSDPRDEDLARAHTRRRRRRRSAVAAHRERHRTVRAAGFQSVLHQSIRLSPEQGRLHGASRVATGLLARRDQAVAGGLRLPILSAQSVQAIVPAERAQGRVGRFAVASERLARAERRGSRRLAAGRQGADPRRLS